VAVITCRQRLARQPALAGLKHLNRLEQVLARAEWRDPAIADGLMFDTDGLLVDGVSSNVFIVSGGHLLTPRLDQCGVAGVLRRLVIERVAPAAGFTVQEAELPAAMLDQADELFLTSSLRGILPVAAIDGRALATQQVTQRLQRQLCEMETLGHV
jgi:4-amino-4-deoxychorismate lyase